MHRRWAAALRNHHAGRECAPFQARCDRGAEVAIHSRRPFLHIDARAMGRSWQASSSLQLSNPTNSRQLHPISLVNRKLPLRAPGMLPSHHGHAAPRGQCRDGTRAPCSLLLRALGSCSPVGLGSCPASALGTCLTATAPDNAAHRQLLGVTPLATEEELHAAYLVAVAAARQAQPGPLGALRVAELSQALMTLTRVAQQSRLGTFAAHVRTCWVIYTHFGHCDIMAHLLKLALISMYF